MHRDIFVRIFLNQCHSCIIVHVSFAIEKQQRERERERERETERERERERERETEMFPSSDLLFSSSELEAITCSVHSIYNYIRSQLLENQLLEQSIYICKYQSPFVAQQQWVYAPMYARGCISFQRTNIL